jgi:ubiquitin carboxyl-terminal hydrolase 48
VLAEGSKLSELVKVFAALQYSKRKVVDPSSLVEALQLKTEDQQDAGE